MQRVYVVETSHALFTLSVMEMKQGGPYSASFVGVPYVERPRADARYRTKIQLDGAAEGLDFNALVAMCHREMKNRGGDIISIEDISGTTS
ncbi:hypothetical protein [Collimonas pratensis]|uniref:hypothetical protein n=1 Tax=Collimonas pratensis TaxID=279113 RepID=UPI0007862C78|nr:hypothetical protein [Collimonas pratensis]